MDGANIEIRDEIGHENMFIFGALASEIEHKRQELRSGVFLCSSRYDLALLYHIIITFIILSGACICLFVYSLFLS
jgi:glucan phosphorylase